MDAVLQLAETLMASPWLYVLIVGLAMLDAIVPVVPAETVVITAGAFAATTGEPAVLWLVLAAWAGALAGDVITHHIGRGAGPLTRRLRRGRLGGALAWAERELAARGGMLIISARFIPGGRTATTLTSGAIGYPRRRFVGFAAIAALLWSLYSVGIGLLGGIAFHEQPLMGVAVGIGLALAVGGSIEAGRALRRRRRQRLQRRQVLSRRRSAARDASPAPAAGG